MKKIILFLFLTLLLVSASRPKNQVYSQEQDSIPPHANPDIEARLDSVKAQEAYLTKSIKTENIKAAQAAQILQEQVNNLDTVKPNLWQRIFKKNVKIKKKD